MTAPVRTGSRSRMFLRMLMRATIVRRGQALTALLAVVTATSVATALLNLYVDVGAKLRKEFRSYGANVIVVAKDNSALPSGTLARVDSVLDRHGLAVPFAYAVVRAADGSPLVAAGTDMERVKKLNEWWDVTAWPVDHDSALIGARAQAVLTSDNKPFDLTFKNRTVHITPAGTLRTGAAEDSRVYLSLDDFIAWTGVQPSVVEISATGSSDEVAAAIRRLAAALPQMEIKPVRQIVEAEGRVLDKTRATLLASAAIIILTAALCVLGTLTTWVLDQRRDFAVMKALGASQSTINALFAAQSTVIGALGGVAGYLIGIGVANWIGRVNFNAAISPRLAVLPVVLIGSIAISLLAAVLPFSVLKRVQPAVILRGE